MLAAAKTINTLLVFDMIQFSFSMPHCVKAPTATPKRALIAINGKRVAGLSLRNVADANEVHGLVKFTG